MAIETTVTKKQYDDVQKLYAGLAAFRKDTLDCIEKTEKISDPVERRSAIKEIQDGLSMFLDSTPDDSILYSLNSSAAARRVFPIVNGMTTTLSNESAESFASKAQTVRKGLCELLDRSKESYTQASATATSRGTPPITVPKGLMTDVARIFEAMKSAEIISTKTETQQILQMFFREKTSMEAIEANKKVESLFNTAKSKMKRPDGDNAKSRNTQLRDFIKQLINDMNESGLDEIERHLEQTRTKHRK